jgi:hypothetical protein
MDWRQIRTKLRLHFTVKSLYIDGRVIALSENNVLARTGVFTYTREFISEVCRRSGLLVKVLGCKHVSKDYLEANFPNLDTVFIEPSVTEEKIAFLSPFYLTCV